MISNIRSVQILIDLLKQKSIRKVVLSPGGSDIPIIHSVETDSYFECYSVVDERSAAYFAMGLSQESKEPVACVCTSGTAVCNYLPGITEAYYQSVPIVAITADKNPNFQGQLETQKIEQTHIFDGVVKKSVNLPLIHCEEDEWLCNRLVNEALIEIDHHGKCPVHINIPIVGRTDIYSGTSTKKERCITLIDRSSSNNAWEFYKQELKKYNRILFVVGQNVEFDEETLCYMETFHNLFGCVFATEHLSNLNINGCINTYSVTEMIDDRVLDGLVPELVISIGNNLSAYNLKPFLRRHYKECTNWLISLNGEVRDAYKSLTTIFECDLLFFLKYMTKNIKDVSHKDYYNLWLGMKKQIKIPEYSFSNIYVAKRLAEAIPNNSILHLAILNSTRIMQFYEINSEIRTYSNVGALGIDGCVSTFMGQAAATDKLSFLVVGDLSFFYDMNATRIRGKKKNIRIVMLNNGGGSEFQFFMGKERIPTLNRNICAEHHETAKGWIESLGYQYFSASNKEEFDNIISVLVADSDKPVFVEVFTDMERDAELTKKIYAENSFAPKTSALKQTIKAVLSEKQIDKAKKIINVIKE
ncbi:2-succinyl-5-enolpyruvyl-6-hydroxy-3-cyclohexene-1-carboxylic-acid synthase [Butyrivibrio sp.]|uniref:2-succinyl-5-enolpyruvyl-6-hydroxy-3- cyclohexene-1-carboxylic-acid synthase n=1 Tax=Butyrivibrio sp. TaxID=28121 RepID=UPI0025BA814E|nr:2-succinyl-5-enolpyruvyl-6-hydroxy-3-cyclohexene-1-carboxylic-acid synthase [Butyrivibrio sp.]MBE5839551.1 2-succinyl-5-enolpyruvyl-6-hydroxy-3-cyclohexene-1-carboxylic-acid synthase [Butyrivibrio sp.]